MNNLSKLFHFPNNRLQIMALLLLSGAFIAAGINHFINPTLYVSIMPLYLPWHLELVYLSGLFEILGGLGILIGGLRRWAGIGLFLLTLAVFPANINMALNPEVFVQIAPTWVWYSRLPVQLLILIWIYWSCLTKLNTK